jgi:hypothetical protein
VRATDLHESNLVCSEQLVVDTAAFACTTNDAVQITDISLELAVPLHLTKELVQRGPASVTAAPTSSSVSIREMNHFRLDTNDTKLQQHVQYYAEPIFPKLDSDGEERVQDQVMHDTRGNPWEFCHIYRVQHDQHKLLPIEWSRNYMAGALDEQIDASVRQHCLWNLQASWRFVFNSSRVLEERYLKQPLGDLGFKRSWAVDPVAPEADVVVSCGGQAAVELADLRTWLNMFLEGSIVYTRATIVFMRRPNGDLIFGLRHNEEEAVPNTLPNRCSMICFIRGLDVGSHLWGNNSTAADHNTAGLRLLWWLKNQTSFQMCGNWDHFIALGHIFIVLEPLIHSQRTTKHILAIIASISNAQALIFTTSMIWVLCKAEKLNDADRDEALLKIRMQLVQIENQHASLLNLLQVVIPLLQCIIHQ